MLRDEARVGEAEGLFQRVICTCDYADVRHSKGLIVIDLISYPLALLVSAINLILLAPIIALQRMRGSN